LLGEVMKAVGVPDGVYNVVHGFGPDSAGAFLTQHPDVDAITFTGETRTGEAIMAARGPGRAAGELRARRQERRHRVRRRRLRPGGRGIARSAFENCGQVCLGTERVYVQRPIFDSSSPR
jgi:aminomuconate-semialdehyde/2-hydroxymuconate-6-semialdehyde dehydrogenase